MTNKKNERVTINLGDRNSKARIIYEEFIKIKGKGAFSEFARHLIINSQAEQYQNKILKYEYKEVGKNVAQLIKRRVEIENEMREKGIDPDEVMFS
ncbi:MAG: hypothetical protein Q8O89_05500 [Nanoarchaeota archaeon]|nr:hypothetical protein [Nanoarchaeota archaeon]